MKAKALLTIFCASICSVGLTQTWQPLGTGTNNWVTALAGSDDNGVLYAGGYFTEAGGTNVGLMAYWNGNSWAPIGSGVDYGIHAISIIDNEIYFGGEFLNANGSSSVRIVKYNGSNWEPMGYGLEGSVNDIAEYNGEIYAGFLDSNFDGDPDGIKKWNGAAWEPVNGGVAGPNPNVLCLTVYNGELYVGGSFSSAGGVNANGVAKWNGSSWSTLNTGLNDGAIVYSLKEFNGELYVGGSFTNAGGISVSNLAKWNGSTWTDVGGGVTGGASGFESNVVAMEVYGTRLYLTGNFSQSGSMVSTSYISSWDGSSYSALGSGLNDRGYALTVFDDELIVGGQFSSAGGNSAAHIARWSDPTVLNLEDLEQTEYSIHPNPSSDYVIIGSSQTGDINFKVYNSMGKLVGAGILAADNNKIDIFGYPQGIYTLHLSDGKQTTVRKIIKVN